MIRRTSLLLFIFDCLEDKAGCEETLEPPATRPTPTACDLSRLYVAPYDVVVDEDDEDEAGEADDDEEEVSDVAESRCCCVVGGSCGGAIGGGGFRYEDRVTSVGKRP